MARLPRLDLPGIPHHIVQRGNHRQACFADAADYLRYRQELGEAALRYDCALHAYVLMTKSCTSVDDPARTGRSLAGDASHDDAGHDDVGGRLLLSEPPSKPTFRTGTRCAFRRYMRDVPCRQRKPRLDIGWGSLRSPPPCKPSSFAAENQSQISASRRNSLRSCGP